MSSWFAFIYFFSCLILYSYRRTYRPLSYHIAQELQKYNIPDYRPRQEQYVPVPLFFLRVEIWLEDSRKRSRRSALYNACGETAVLPSARLRILENKIKLN